MATSFRRAPPPRISRRASPFDLANPTFTSAAIMPRPSASSADSEICGNPSPTPPSAKVCCAVCMASPAASAPWQSVVASFARMILASLISAPSSAPRRRTSSIGSSVKSDRKRSTSASSVLRQNCQNWNGDRRSAFSQIAPSAVLPILAPDAVVISGDVRPNTSWLSTRRVRSMPVTMLPHWSDPPICSTQPYRRRSSMKS